MDSFEKELEIGEIHLRDRWQFELKSEFFPLPHLKNNKYTQEFYCFIPNVLQVNRDTYSKEQFYKDRTLLIRYKTPEFTFKELLDPANERSPFTRLWKLRLSPNLDEWEVKLKDELKLLGSVIRSALRLRVGELIEDLERPSIQLSVDSFSEKIENLCAEIMRVRDRFNEIYKEYNKAGWKNHIHSHFVYIDEFISNSLDYYLVVLLETFRFSPIASNKKIDKNLCDVIITEKKHREEMLHEPRKLPDDPVEHEYILYRSGLLNKFVLDALLLHTVRSSLDVRLRNIIGSLAAGIAMLFFFLLFVWQGGVFVINSMPFIIMTVVLYILKDRLKESLKNVSFQLAAKWFPDYYTKIRSPDGKFLIGHLQESFSFVHENELPAEVMQVRDREFHAVLEEIKRPERVMYYKKIVSLKEVTNLKDTRRTGLNIIFRYYIHEFVNKVDDPVHSYISLDSETLQLIRIPLPKVYHLNIILKNTFIQEDYSTKIEWKKYRLILDKNGLRRIEHIHT